MQNAHWIRVSLCWMCVRPWSWSSLTSPDPALSRTLLHSSYAAPIPEKKIGRANKEHDATFVCCTDLKQIIKGKQGLVLPHRGSNLETFHTTWQYDHDQYHPYSWWNINSDFIISQAGCLDYSDSLYLMKKSGHPSHVLHLKGTQCEHDTTGLMN